MNSRFFNLAIALFLLALLPGSHGLVLGQDASGDTQGASAASAPSSPGGETLPPVPESAAPDATLQVPAPSVTLPTPPLPPPPPLPEPSPEAKAEASPTPQASQPEFNPPSAASLDLPSAQPPGNPQYASASQAMPSMKMDEFSGEAGPGALGGMFDWAKKLRFQAALRSGYDSNVNSAPSSNAVASWFGNVNGAVNYRFGTPRLNFDADLTGGLTWYPQVSNQANQMQGVIGLGMSVEYRCTPRLVTTFNTSSSYQQQPNPGLIGTSANSNGSYFYSASSLAAAYQWTEHFTTVSRLNYTFNAYLQQSLNNQQGFNQPGFTQSFRWLTKPTTTAVVDYNTNFYDYAQGGNDSWGQSLAGGFDHVFNPKWFWNFRGGAEYRTFQNSNRGNGSYIGPYLDNNFGWQFGKHSLNWMAHLGTQPSGQQNVSYSPAFRTGLNYTQKVFTRVRLNMGFFYLLQYFNDSNFGPNGSLIDYYQTSMQGNVDVTYDMNRILQLALGYQYLTLIAPSVPNQEYNRGITYLQLKAAF
jgi:hypothetical protein